MKLALSMPRDYTIYLRSLFLIVIISSFGVLKTNAAGQIEVPKEQTVHDDNGYNNPWSVVNVPNPKTESNSWVSNPDGVLSSIAEEEINEILQALEDSLSVEVAVVALNSIGYNEPRDFAHELFNEWGIGKKRDDNGLLILLTVDIRDITFETGYGLEGVLPDALCKRIQMNEMVPYLKNDNWDEGMVSGVKAVVQTIYTGDYNQPDKGKEGWLSAYISRLPDTANLLMGVFLFLINLLVWIKVTRKLRLKELTPIAARNYLNKYEKTGVVNFTNGIILFPVWPALLGIVIWFRIWNLPLIKKIAYTCSKCGANSVKLVKYAKPADMNILTDYERIELKLKTIQIRIYKCDACGEIIKDCLPLKSSCRPCPACHNYTLVPKSKSITVRKATTDEDGLTEIKYKCTFCGAFYAIDTIIPQIDESSSSSGGSFGGSSSSSGGGSFGGGSSGGGGASSRF